MIPIVRVMLDLLVILDLQVALELKENVELWYVHHRSSIELALK